MNFVIPEIIRERKKILVGVLIGLIVVGLTMGGWVFLKGEQGEFISPLSQVSQEEEEPQLLLWDDEAGFTFEYPQGLYIDPHPEDMENYAHLEITSPKKSGRILILVNDASTETIEEWVKADKEATSASIIDTSLAGAAAKKLLFKDPKTVLTAAIDPYGGLFLLRLEPGEGDFWQNIYQQILKSFAFKPLSEEEKALLEEGEERGEASGGVIYEEEEVIE